MQEPTVRDFFKPSFHALALAATLASPLAAIAADPPTQYNAFFLNLGYGAGLTQLATFSNNFNVANTPFVDDYYFNLPPPTASFAASGNSGLGFSYDPVKRIFSTFQAVEFYSVDLYAFTGESIDLVRQVQSDSFQAVSSNDQLTSGIYVLEITGKALIANAIYYGGIVADVSPLPPSPVPEPHTLAMMLAGVGVLGLLGRRRARQLD